MKSKNLVRLAVLIIISVPIIYAAIVYPKLPQIIPVHFGLDGKPNRFGDKKEMLVMVGVMTVISIGIHLLFANIHKIDPKKSAQLSKGIMQKISVAVVIFLSIISIIMVQSSYNSNIAFEKIVLPLVGIMLAYIGNLMYSIKPNYFAGFRTPWALENEDNWRTTHHLASKMWVGGGLLIALVGVLLPFIAAFITTMVITAIITIIPFVHSFKFYKKNKAEQQPN